MVFIVIILSSLNLTSLLLSLIADDFVESLYRNTLREILFDGFGV